MKLDASPIIVDVGGTYTRVGLASDAAPSHVSCTPHGNIPLVQSIVEKVKEFCKDRSVVQDVVVVGFPGYVSNGGHVKRANNLDITDLNLKVELKKHLKCHVIAINDAKLQAMAFSDDKSTVVYLVFGTGVGGAIVSKGHCFWGENGFAGELGHMYLPGTDADCLCGRQGCLEASSSGAYFVKRFGENWWDNRNADAVIQHIEFLGSATALLADSICQLVDPSVFAIAGHLAKDDRFRRHFQIGFAPRNPKVRLSFEPDVWALVAHGAVKLASLSD